MESYKIYSIDNEFFEVFDLNTKETKYVSTSKKVATTAMHHLQKFNKLPEELLQPHWD